MSRTKKAKVPSQRDMAQRMLIERKGAGAGKHHTRERDVLKGIRRKGKHPMRYEQNPFYVTPEGTTTGFRSSEKPVNSHLAKVRREREALSKEAAERSAEILAEGGRLPVIREVSMGVGMKPMFRVHFPGQEPSQTFTSRKRAQEFMMSRMTGKPYRSRDNPFHKPGADQYGRVCFFIYNDDGSQVVGPSGPKFCYTVEKAEEMVKKAEAAGKRVSPSAVSPGPRVSPAAAAAPLPAAPPPVPPSVSSPGLTILESKFEQLRPILNHHLVMSYLASIRSMGTPRTPEYAAQHAPKVHGIAARKKYAVIHSGMATNLGTGQKRAVPEFVVNMETMDISRADPDGQPRVGWNYGTIDEVIARGVTLKPRQNPMGWV